MTQLTIRVRGELVRQGLQDLGAEMPKIGRRQISLVMQRVMRRLSKPGDHPKGKIKWDSEKQRKAYFATDGFGAGIPYVRTSKYEDAWKAEPLTNGYRLTNNASYAQYVGGDAYGLVHSGIHAGRWPVYRDVVDEEIEKLPDDIEEEIVMVARKEGL